jgi:hypothetical protein
MFSVGHAGGPGGRERRIVTQGRHDRCCVRPGNRSCATVHVEDPVPAI